MAGEPVHALDLRRARCWRNVAAALGSDGAVDNGHADAGQVAELDAVPTGADMNWPSI